MTPDPIFTRMCDVESEVGRSRHGRKRQGDRVAPGLKRKRPRLLQRGAGVS